MLVLRKRLKVHSLRGSAAADYVAARTAAMMLNGVATCDEILNPMSLRLSCYQRQFSFPF